MSISSRIVICPQSYLDLDEIKLFKEDSPKGGFKVSYIN